MYRCVQNENSSEYDTGPVYAERYTREHDEISKGKVSVWCEEVLSEFEADSSVFIFGSGHSFIANHINSLPNVGSLSVCDIVGEAANGLDEDIEFNVLDVLEKSLPGTFDYIFSSHTVEHFTRDEIMNNLIDKCLINARKAVVFLTPYRDIAWSEAPEHKVQLSESDELAAKASRFKRIGPQGEELVLWFPGEGV